VTGEASEKYVDKAHRRDRVNWDVERQIEVAPQYRRPHMALVAKVPMGFIGATKYAVQ
jgi:hypothetical protein